MVGNSDYSVEYSGTSPDCNPQKRLRKIPIFEIIRISEGMGDTDVISCWRHDRHPEWSRHRIFNPDLLFDIYDFKKKIIGSTESPIQSSVNSVHVRSE
jgi:hypothetical protein